MIDAVFWWSDWAMVGVDNWSGGGCVEATKCKREMIS